MNSKVNAAEKADDTTQGTSIFGKFSCMQKSRVEPVNSDPVLKDKVQKILKEQKHILKETFHQKDQICFIQKTFHQKECGRFIPKKDQFGDGKSCLVKDLRCYCGEVLSMHAGIETYFGIILDSGSIIPPEHRNYLTKLDVKLSEPLPDLKRKWEPKDINKSTTTAFGNIDFNVQQIQGRKPAKIAQYVRISNDDKVEDVLELMKNVWCILKPEPPNLVISVVGGAKNLDGLSRTIFTTGLIKTAKTTKAWVITSGCNIGIIKLVGQVINEGQSFHWGRNRLYHELPCIGIAPWGYIKDRQCLERDGSDKFNAQYRSSTQIEHKQPVPLNSDHTHFILVDDGFRNRYSGVAEFRSKFEKLITQEKDEGGLGIPVVLILVEGGTDSIKQVNASLKQEIPVVVCDGTGRAADILSYAYSNMSENGSKERAMKAKCRDELTKKIAQAYKKEGPALEKLTKLVIDCCQRQDLVVIFNIKNDKELDLAILYALLRAEIRPSTMLRAGSLELTLNWAMTWNRADVAQDEIFREDVTLSPETLAKCLTNALINEKIEFVKLLLNNGIIIQEYLTTNRLEKLYNLIPEDFYLRNILIKSSKLPDNATFKIEDITDFLKKMLDRYDDDMIVSEDKNKKPVFFQRPYKQLLIWAVLTNKNDLAHLFLELGEEPITSALICTALCLGMERRVPKYPSTIRSSFAQMKVEFEKLAISVLDECHDQKHNNAIMLVERKSPAWSHLTCLQIAVSTNNQKFVLSAACQNSIDNVWKRGIMSTWPKVFLCAICPLLILWLIDINEKALKHPTMVPVVLSKEEEEEEKVSKMQEVAKMQKVSEMKKLLFFYSAPVTKFSLYSGAYVAFLALFTYMLSVDYQDTPSATEWVTFVWIISFFIGMIHTFLVFPLPTFKGKFRDYFKILQKLEFVNLLLAIFAFGVRWRYNWEGKTIYCVNAIIFYISIMKLYTANRILGPKIYMFFKMMIELLIFILVLVVFLLAYGVASQALLYRQRDSSWYVLKDIVYLPYWQLFGELFLEDLETDETCTQAQLATHGGTLGELDITCRTFHWLVPVLLALYLLVGNVLLLNLLIAIFSHVFATVEQNSIEIWKYQMYFLVMEFQNQSMLVPPLSLLFHMWHLLRWLYFKLSCQQRPKAEQFDDESLEYLAFFEKEMLANKLRQANAPRSDDVKFSVLQTRIDELDNKLGKLIEEEVQSDISHEPNEDKPESDEFQKLQELTRGNRKKDRQMNKATIGSIRSKINTWLNTGTPATNPLPTVRENSLEDENTYFEKSLSTPHDAYPMSGAPAPASQLNRDDIVDESTM